MSNIESKYDVFIAYSLNAYNNSSEALRQSNYLKALEIYNYLSKLGYTTYFLQPDDPNLDYTKTPQIASKCKLFLFVTDKNTISKYSSKSLSDDFWVYNELCGFISQNFINNKIELAKPFVQVYTEDDTLLDSEVNNLHLVFQGKNPIRTKINLQSWIKTQREKDVIITAIDTGWDEEVAHFWKTIYAPARPSSSEIDFYREFFKHKKKYITIKPKVLILGSTKELIKLALDEHLDIYIADNSKSYCNIILNDFKEYDTKITPIYCNWENMDDEVTIQNIKFDIIIGDMSIGNISPNNIEKTIATISNLLCNEGVWLGKSIYKFSKTSNRDEIKHHIQNLFSNDDINAENIFSSTVYDIAMLSCKKESHDNNIEWYEMDFEQLAVTSQELYDEIQKNCDKDISLFKNVYEKFSLLGRKKIPFYIYHIKNIAALSNKHHLFIKDVGFGNDPYSLKFPLIVFEKRINNGIITVDKTETETTLEQINTFFPRKQDKDFAKEWSKHLPSQYYLVMLSKLVDMENNTQWVNTCNNIKKDIIDTIDISINTDLLCYIKELKDTKIDDELRNIKNSYLLTTIEEQQLKETYKLAVLLYLSTNLIDSDNSKKTVLYNLVIDKLFESRLYDNICKQWLPDGVPWLTAKVCNAAYGTTYSQIHNENLISSVKKLINNYNKIEHNWNCSVGSHMDTCALCIESILNYFDKFKSEYKKKATAVLKDLLTTYVLNQNIYETIALHPLGQHVIARLTTPSPCQTITFQKKVLGSVAFFSALLRIINFFKQKEPELLEGSNCEPLILAHLMNFWEQFKTLDENTFNRINSIDICTVPQILYSLSQALASEVT